MSDFKDKLNESASFPETPRLDQETRDRLGQHVRDAWIAWANTQKNPKDSWLVQYCYLSEEDKEADRMIGERLFVMGVLASPSEHCKISVELFDECRRRSLEISNLHDQLNVANTKLAIAEDRVRDYDKIKARNINLVRKNEALTNTNNSQG